MGTSMNEDYRNYCSEDVEEARRPDIKVLSSRIKVSRRDRPCACWRWLNGISAGDRYREVVMVVEGKFEIVNDCLTPCASAELHDTLMRECRVVPQEYGPDENPF